MPGCLRLVCAHAPANSQSSSGRLAASVLSLLLAVGGVTVEVSEIAPAATSLPERISGHDAQQEAISAIPLRKINPKYRQPVAQVLNNPSLYRRLPTQIVDCDPALFTYMAQNPEVLVAIWKHLGITKVQLDRIGENTFRLADGAGTTGTLSIVEQQCEEGAQNRIVMFAEGGYEGKPFSKPVTAECVLLLRSGSVVETNGRTYVAAQLDSFLHIDRASIELFAKVMHPLVGRTADKNFADTVTFIGSFSQAAEFQPQRIERFVSSLPRIDAQRQHRLVHIAYALAESAPRVAQRTPTASEPVQRLAANPGAGSVD